MLKNNSGGYTLTEILMVLSIFLLIVSLSINLYPPYIERMEIKQFVKQFGDDLFYAQQYAISHEQQTTVYMYSDNYKVSSSSGDYTLQRTLPAHVTFKNRTLGERIAFNSVGTAITSGIMHVQSKHETYKLTVYIGKGRFKFEKV
ncbi:prepilin-type N-terminal cleavage/methylation domain-containing protein [Peribacillus asahii]|uniref:Prepilin-type N-terminal cleavage/methylation domain-containing protein n=1 Tax=Peribacillus asahii TaxID=228899 RepID=A0A398BNM5_9BACI|nr:competence type IV pilus minor pilin ComGD [Peribacillus asahii]RID89410.1 prepilin-type N-terminal cleavage/methylation domain-containing protein [Peribacillus asahii]